jgi:hypothetical protein
VIRGLLRLHGLSVFFLVLFVLAVIGQSIAGYFEYNDHQQQHGEATFSYLRYLRSSDFGADMLENWQSEWLQFWVFALATVWLVQKGSAESKKPEDIGLESDEKQLVGGYAPENAPRWAKMRGWRLRLYENSFIILMGLIFLGSWLGQSFTGWTAFNDEQRSHDAETLAWLEYLGSANFWERSLQNWQSEFLAVGTMVVFTIYLRQRGSPESKPVGAPHTEGGETG